VPIHLPSNQSVGGERRNAEMHGPAQVFLWAG